MGNGVRGVRVWQGLLGLKKAVVEGVDLDADEDVVVVRVRPVKAARGRCGRCQRRCPRYDQGEGRRRWRTLDAGTRRVVLEADAPRVRCPQHDVVVASVPWARHDARHCRAFDDTVAWLATHADKSAVTDLMRIAWRSVGAIVARVWADIDRLHDRFAGLRRLGIDEISYKRGHQYLMVVLDLDTGRLVWCAPGRTTATMQRFFELLGPQRCAQITHVASDGAEFIGSVVARNCPNAERCADPFHVIRWASDALDLLRRQIMRRARRSTAKTVLARQQIMVPENGESTPPDLRGIRYALLKNPENLTKNQQVKLQWIAITEPQLHQGYLLKEGLRMIFRLSPDEAPDALQGWLDAARASGIPLFARLADQVARQHAAILAAITHGVSNGLTESANAKIRLIIRAAFGFHSPEPLIALAMLRLGGHRPALPGRT